MDGISGLCLLSPRVVYFVVVPQKSGKKRDSGVSYSVLVSFLGHEVVHRVPPTRYHSSPSGQNGGRAPVPCSLQESVPWALHWHQEGEKTAGGGVPRASGDRAGWEK